MPHNDLTSALQTNLANLHILNVKLHSYHWKVEGMQFYSVHVATEKYYDYVFGLFDDVAERMLQMGVKPLSTVVAYLENATLEEEKGAAFKPAEVLRNVLADFKVLLGDAKKIAELADAQGDVPTGNIYGEHIQWLEKEIWMLTASLA